MDATKIEWVNVIVRNDRTWNSKKRTAKMNNEKKYSKRKQKNSENIKKGNENTANGCDECCMCDNHTHELVRWKERDLESLTHARRKTEKEKREKRIFIFSENGRDKATVNFTSCTRERSHSRLSHLQFRLIRSFHCVRWKQKRNE